MQTPILTDSRARQYRYTDSGLVPIKPTHWTPPKPEEIPQPWHYKLFHKLICCASHVRW